MDQLALYALGYKDLSGEKADFLEIYNLDENRPFRQELLDHDLTDTKRKIITAANAIRENRLELPSGPLTITSFFIPSGARWGGKTSAISFRRMTVVIPILIMTLAGLGDPSPLAHRAFARIRCTRSRPRLVLSKILQKDAAGRLPNLNI